MTDCLRERECVCPTVSLEPSCCSTLSTVWTVRMDCSYWLYYRLDRLRSLSLKYSRQQYGTLTGPHIGGGVPKFWTSGILGHRVGAGVPVVPNFAPRCPTVPSGVPSVPNSGATSCVTSVGRGGVTFQCQFWCHFLWGVLNFF